jgi:endonuclease/exonuclease/phosphatase family metal-dependent hydrolase
MSAKLLLEFQEDIKLNSKVFKQRSEHSNIRFLTFNVHMWKDFNNKNKYEEILDVIRTSDADIVGLQEAMLFDKKISQKYKKDFEHMGYQYQIVCNEKYGINMLFSKYPIITYNILKLKQDPIQKLHRYAIFAEINVGISMNVIVTHLDVYDETEQTRLDQINTIIKELGKHNDLQTIIMGDFNSLRRLDYSDEEWNKLTLHDSKRNVIPMTLVTDYLERCGFVTNNLSMSVWAMRRVDYIYTKSTFNVLCHDTYPTNVSDHYPVYMDISF